MGRFRIQLNTSGVESRRAFRFCFTCWVVDGLHPNNSGRRMPCHSTTAPPAFPAPRLNLPAQGRICNPAPAQQIPLVAIAGYSGRAPLRHKQIYPTIPVKIAEGAGGDGCGRVWRDSVNRAVIHIFYPVQQNAGGYWGHLNESAEILWLVSRNSPPVNHPLVEVVHHLRFDWLPSEQNPGHSCEWFNVAGIAILRQVRRYPFPCPVSPLAAIVGQGRYFRIPLSLRIR